MRLVATGLFLDGFFHEPDQWSRPFFNEESMLFEWAEPQTSYAELKRMADRGFKVLVAA